MTKTYYRQILGVIKKCKGCGKQWRPKVYSLGLQGINLCAICRKPYYQKFYREYQKSYIALLNPDKKERLNKQLKKAWYNWVKRNPAKRRGQALASYHKNKSKKRNIQKRKTRRRKEYKKFAKKRG